MAFPLAAQGVYKAVMFGVYGSMQRRITGGERRPLALWELYVSGAVAGGANTLVVAPVELVRNRLMVQYGKAGAPGQYLGPFDVVKRVLATDGVLGLWKGLGPTLMR
jgi:solute carrier family 25 carnitine/acylcarnitine transporter 20/29